jgi:hypothetical protein
MKVSLVIILLMTFACSSKDTFHLNSRDSAKFESLISSFDFCVVYYFHQPSKITPYKLLGMKRENGEDSWYKVNYTDSFIQLVGKETLMVDYKIEKKITIDEANLFMSALANSNAYKVNFSKNNLVVDCIIYNANRDGYTETLDADFIDFRVYSDTFNIKTIYFEPFRSHVNCPNNDEWKKAILLADLFKQNWIVADLRIDSLRH